MADEEFTDRGSAVAAVAAFLIGSLALALIVAGIAVVLALSIFRAAY
jgi:hypothetical protein